MIYKKLYFLGVEMELMKLVAIPTVSHTHLIEVNTMSTMQ